MTNEPMTSEEYLEKAGQVCPGCRATDEVAIAGDREGDIFTSGPAGRKDWSSRCTQAIFCGRCGAHWVDVYTISGYTNLEPGGAPKKGTLVLIDECPSAEDIQRVREECGDNVNELPS